MVVSSGIPAYLCGKAVAVECSLEVFVEARGLQGSVLLLGGEEEAGGFGQGQSLSGSVKESLLAATGRHVEQQHIKQRRT